MGDNPANTDPVGANDTSSVLATAAAAGAQGTNPTAPQTTTPVGRPQPFYQSAPFIETPSLKSLGPEDVISFLHAFDCAKEMVDANGSQTMLLKAYIDGRVMREISEVYRAKTDAEIRAVLDKIVEDYDANKLEDGFLILKEQLKWPKDEPTLDRAVTKFLQDIRRVMSKEDLKGDRVVIKQVVKEAIRHLPKFFNLEPSDYSNLGKYIEVGHKKLLPKSEYDMIKREQDRRRDSGERENLLDQFEQLLRMKAWANRDKQVSKQKIIDLRQVVPAEPTPADQQLVQANTQQVRAALDAPPPDFQPFNANVVPFNQGQPQQPATTAMVPYEFSPLMASMDNLTAALSNPQFQRRPQGGRFPNQGPQGLRREPRCFCCGEVGHRVQQCPILLEFYQATGRQPPFAQRPFRQNRQPRQQMPNSNFAQFPIMNALQPRPSRPMRDPNRALDIIVQKMEGLNAEQATIEVFAPDMKWHAVKGCLDSGATVTVGSAQLHEQFCGDIEFMRKRRDVVLPNGFRIPVIKQAKIYARAKHRDNRVNQFPRMKIALIDSAQWNWLLIGWDELYRANATPEQALHASATLPNPNQLPMFQGFTGHAPLQMPEMHNSAQIQMNYAQQLGELGALPPAQTHQSTQASTSPTSPQEAQPSPSEQQPQPSPVNQQ